MGRSRFQVAAFFEWVLSTNRISGAGWRGSFGGQHVGGDAGKEKTEDRVGKESAQRLELGRVQKRATGNGAETRQSRARERQRGRGVREGRKGHRGGILRANAGSRCDGAAG